MMHPRMLHNMKVKPGSVCERRVNNLSERWQYMQRNSKLRFDSIDSMTAYAVQGRLTIMKALFVNQHLQL